VMLKYTIWNEYGPDAGLCFFFLGTKPFLSKKDLVQKFSKTRVKFVRLIVQQKMPNGKT